MHGQLWSRSRRGSSIAALLVALAFFPGWGHASEVVLFDEGNGQRFSADQKGDLDLSGLAEVFRKEGLRVETTREPLSGQTLAGKSALVISGPFEPLQPTEIDAVVAFLDRGGKLCVALHVAPPVASLLGRLGVNSSNGVVHEAGNVLGDRDLDFRVTRLRPHALTSGIREFSVYGSWALINATADVEIVARTTSLAWVDLNGNGEQDADTEAAQSLGILATGELGKGEFAVFADDAVFQNRFLRDGNLDMATNLARWLVAN